MAGDNTLRFRTVVDDKATGFLKTFRKEADKAFGKGSSSSFWGNVGAKGVAKGFDLVGDAASAATQFVGDSIEAASALAEQTSKSNVIFDDNAAAIQAWAATGAQAFGQSKRQALETASGFAGLFSTVGTGIDESTERAKKLTELGSDLASFFDTDVQTALDALRSGLSGESEPLRRFNVFLSETAVTAKLAQMGVKKVGSQFTESQKATARYQLILEQTSAAQGDFARTAEGLANSQRRADGQLENLQASLGEKLLPAQVAVTQAQIDFVEGLDVVGDHLAGVDKAVRDAQIGLHDFITFWEDDAAVRSAAATEAAVRHMADASKDDLANVVTAAGDAAAATAGIGAKADEAAAAYAAAMAEITGSVQAAATELETAGQDAANATFDPIIQKAELARLELEEKRLRNLRDSAAANSQEREDAQATLNEVNKQKVEVLSALAAHGDESSQIALEAMAKTQLANKNLSLEAQAYWNNVLVALIRVKNTAAELARLRFMANATKDDTARASGGPVWPGVWTVGERGPETLVLGPSGEGYVYPHANGGGGGGGGASLVVQFNSIWPPTEAQARAIADVVDRQLYRKMTSGAAASGDGF